MFFSTYFKYPGASNSDSEEKPAKDRSPNKVHWELDEEDYNHTQNTDLSILMAPKNIIDKTREINLILDIDNNIDNNACDKRLYYSSKGDKGAEDGIHDWTFEFLHRSNTPYSVGVVMGDLYPYDFIGGPCLHDERYPHTQLHSQKHKSSLSSSSSHKGSKRWINNTSTATTTTTATTTPPLPRVRLTTSTGTATPAPLRSSTSSFTSSSSSSSLPLSSTWFQDRSRSLLVERTYRSRQLQHSSSRGIAGRLSDGFGNENSTERTNDRTAVAFRRLLRASAPEFTPSSPLIPSMSGTGQTPPLLPMPPPLHSPSPLSLTFPPSHTSVTTTRSTATTTTTTTAPRHIPVSVPVPSSSSSLPPSSTSTSTSTSSALSSLSLIRAAFEYDSEETTARTNILDVHLDAMLSGLIIPEDTVTSGSIILDDTERYLLPVNPSRRTEENVPENILETFLQNAALEVSTSGILGNIEEVDISENGNERGIVNEIDIDQQNNNIGTSFSPTSTTPPSPSLIPFSIPSHSLTRPPDTGTGTLTPINYSDIPVRAPVSTGDQQNIESLNLSVPISTDSDDISKSTGGPISPTPVEGIEVTEKTNESVPIKADHFAYVDRSLALGWHSDGSLWVNGNMEKDSFGAQFLPIDRMGSITVRVDRIERTVTYYVNGVFVGIAFGPTGSGAAVCCPLPEVSQNPMGSYGYHNSNSSSSSSSSSSSTAFSSSSSSSSSSPRSSSSSSSSFPFTNQTSFPSSSSSFPSSSSSSSSSNNGKNICVYPAASIGLPGAGGDAALLLQSIRLKATGKFSSTKKSENRVNFYRIIFY